MTSSGRKEESTVGSVMHLFRTTRMRMVLSHRGTSGAVNYKGRRSRRCIGVERRVV
jgi:hypothetical protein